MLSENVLFEICSYLALPDLLQMKQVNKKFRKTASSPSLFKQEFFRIYLRSRTEQLRISASWPALCYSMLKSESQLKSLPIPTASKPNFFNFFSFLTETLSNPEIPLPKLRREQFSFPTVIQDMLANLEDFQSESFRNDFHDLKIIETGYFQSGLFDSHLVLTAFQAFFKLVEVYCEGICLAIEESEDPLKDYLDLWEKFSFSVVNLTTFAQGGLFDGITEKWGVNVHALLIGIWKEKVWKKMGDFVVTCFLEGICRVLRMDCPESEFIVCCRFVEAVLDISLNEFSVHFKTHSRSEFEEPFKMMEKRVLMMFRGIRIKEDKELERMNLLNTLFPSCLLKKIVDEIRMEEDWRNEFEDFRNHVESRDFLIEYHAKKIGISQSELGFYSSCRNSEIFDLLTHLQEFKEDVCN